MDTEHWKLAPTEPDLQTRLEQERRDLLAACRLVAAHVAWTKHARETGGAGPSERLDEVERYLAAEIEALEQAE